MRQHCRGPATDDDDHIRRFLDADQFVTHEDLAFIPATGGVYGWWFDLVPPGVPTSGCEIAGSWTLLHVGISPKEPPTNGKPPSRQTIRSRIRYHYRGKAEGSTLRLTLGTLLGDKLDLSLRLVGSGTRRTFGDGEHRLSEWMGEHARVTYLVDPEPWRIEQALIARLSVPLNLDHNRSHPFHPHLSALRKAAKDSATTR
jgi:hypothetical protein